MLKENKEFKAGKKVFVFNSRMRIFSRKLKTRWYEPFVVKEAFPHGAVELSNKTGQHSRLTGIE